MNPAKTAIMKSKNIDGPAQSILEAIKVAEDKAIDFAGMSSTERERYIETWCGQVISLYTINPELAWSLTRRQIGNGGGFLALSAYALQEEWRSQERTAGIPRPNTRALVGRNL